MKKPKNNYGNYAHKRYTWMLFNPRLPKNLCWRNVSILKPFFFVKQSLLVDASSRQKKTWMFNDFHLCRPKKCIDFLCITCVPNECVTHTILHDLWSPLRIMGSQNWWFGDPRTVRHTGSSPSFLEGPCWFLGPINSQIWPSKTATSSCCTFLASCSMSRYSVSWETTNSHDWTKDWTCVWYISLTSRVGFGSTCR